MPDGKLAKPTLTPLTEEKAVAHAIRNHLAAIVGNAQGVVKRLDSTAGIDDPTLRQRLARIETAAWAIEELLDRAISPPEPN